MQHAGQAAVAGHVDTVVVARAEVERGKQAIVKHSGKLVVATQQRRAAVVVPLGLKNTASAHCTELADGTVYRAEQFSPSQRPGIRLEGAGEEIIKTSVAGRIRIRCLGHVDLVALHKPADQGSAPSTGTGAGDLARQQGHGLLGQQVLRQHSETV